MPTETELIFVTSVLTNNLGVDKHQTYSQRHISNSNWRESDLLL